jgi:hypothetical protein
MLEGVLYILLRVYIQGDQNVSVNVIIIDKVTRNVQSVPLQTPDIQLHLTA